MSFLEFFTELIKIGIKMNNEMMCELLNAYDHATDKIIRKHLGIALRRAADLYTQESMPSNKYDVTVEEIRVGKTINKITAVKMYRDRTGLGLKESKDAIESCFDRNGLQFYSSFDNFYDEKSQVNY